MAAGRRLLEFAPAWMWLFWLAGALVIAAGFLRGGEAEPRFLVATGRALEVWRGAERESTLVRLDDAQIFDAAPSPNGALIAFVALSSAPGDFGTDLYLAGRDGGSPRVLLRHSMYGEYIASPVWLHGGDALAYSIVTPLPGADLDRRVEAIDVTSGRRRRIAADVDQPALMPNGRQLIVRANDFRPTTSGEKPALIDIATGAQSDLPAFTSRSLRYIGSFVASPDGRRIAFGAADASVAARDFSGVRGTSLRASKHPILQDVYVMDTDGANLRRIADLAVNQPSIAWSASSLFVYAIAPEGFWQIDASQGRYREIGRGRENVAIKQLPGR